MLFITTASLQILFNGFNQTKMKQFLEWVTKSGTFLFNNEYSEQIDVVLMGGKESKNRFKFSRRSGRQQRT